MQNLSISKKLFLNKESSAFATLVIFLILNFYFLIQLNSSFSTWSDLSSGSPGMCMR